VLRYILKKVLLPNEYSKDILPRLSSLLKQRIAADEYNNTQSIMLSLVRLPALKLGGRVDITLTIYKKVVKTIDTGENNRAESILYLLG
jgi:hypothetical protein